MAQGVELKERPRGGTNVGDGVEARGGARGWAEVRAGAWVRGMGQGVKRRRISSPGFLQEGWRKGGR